MNSEEQTRFGLEKLTERDELSKSILGISLFALASFVVIKTYQYLFRAEELDEQLPPIIIKSGSFVIETDRDLEIPSGGNPPFVYKRKKFGAIQHIRLFKINEENGNHDIDIFTDSTGIEVKIWIQYFEQYLPDGSIKWTPLVDERKITIKKNSSNDFELELKLEKRLLNKKVKKHPKRKAEYKDNESETFRFGKVQVYEINDDDTTVYDVEDGDKFIIAFY
ncbi:hypothetical protein BH24ACI2_BH24ACI2_02010 [soil metagenome]